MTSFQVNKEDLDHLPPEKRKKAFKEKIKDIEVCLLVISTYLNLHFFSSILMLDPIIRVRYR